MAKLKLKKLVVLGSDGTIFDLKPEESTFDYLLEHLGKGNESRRLQEEYLKEKHKGPYKLEERVKLFKGIKINVLKRASEDYINERLRPDFQDTVKELKKRGYLIAISTSNPTVPYEILQKQNDIDFVMGTKLEVRNGVCTGRYEPLRFTVSFERAYKSKYPDLSDKWTTEPNRYGLTQKLAELIKREHIDVDKSWLIGNKVTRVPQATIIKNLIVFEPADKEVEKEAIHVIKKGQPLRKILDYVR